MKDTQKAPPAVRIVTMQIGNGNTKSMNIYQPCLFVLSYRVCDVVAQVCHRSISMSATIQSCTSFYDASVRIDFDTYLHMLLSSQYYFFKYFVHHGCPLINDRMSKIVLSLHRRL